MFNLFNKDKCSFSGCSNQPVDKLSQNGEIQFYCREHLKDKLNIGFLQNEDKMVVVYPNFEFHEGKMYYLDYSPVDKLEEKNMGHIKEFTVHSLNSITGVCNNCGQPAKVAYYKGEKVLWENGYPSIEKIETEAEMKCKKCTLDLLAESVKKYRHKFTNPVVIASGGEGIYYPWQM